VYSSLAAVVHGTSADDNRVSLPASRRAHVAWSGRLFSGRRRINWVVIVSYATIMTLRRRPISTHATRYCYSTLAIRVVAAAFDKQIYGCRENNISLCSTVGYDADDCVITPNEWNAQLGPCTVQLLRIRSCADSVVRSEKINWLYIVNVG